MKYLLLFISFIISNTIFSQCKYENIFPLKHGITKFKATTSMAMQKDFSEDVEMNKYSSSFYSKPAYLKGDSVHFTITRYNHVQDSCITTANNRLYLTFVDDKLYKFRTTYTFTATEFEKCMELYENIFSILKSTFIYYQSMITENQNTKEQKGEGYFMFKEPEEKRNLEKIEFLNISYEINYKEEWDSLNKKYNKTNTISNYEIIIEYVNLKGTKLTSEEF